MFEHELSTVPGLLQISLVFTLLSLQSEFKLHLIHEPKEHVYWHWLIVLSETSIKQALWGVPGFKQVEFWKFLTTLF